MKRYVVKRMLFLIPFLWILSVFAFLLMDFSGSDPAEAALRANQIAPTEEAVQIMRRQLGLDRPLPIRYVEWLKGALQGDFGQSYVDHRTVVEKLREALPYTLALALASLCVALGSSFFLGIFCGFFEDTFFDKIIRGWIALTMATPTYWSGLWLMRIFSVQFGWLPTSGALESASIILPAVTLAQHYAAMYAKLIRNNICVHKREYYVFCLRARGIKERAVMRHILKNSLQPSLISLGMSAPKFIAGSVIIENIFAWPGLGRLCITAILNRDYPVIQAYILFMAVLFAVCNLIVDVVGTGMNPRLNQK